ncbi:ABC transporter permease [Georgenia sp. M64]|uniref:ABC transporter permease n=1 Tax=Georgenia sp. M64 TaxID=3120520 RepID=UPI0030E1EB7E
MTARPGRLVAGVLAIGLALMMILLLDGLWAGVQERATTYEDHLGADLVVVAPGTESLFSDRSTLPAELADVVAAVPGVTGTSRARTMYTILELHGDKAAAAVVGFAPGGPGEPWDLAEGRAPADGEVAVDRLLSQEHGLALALGDTLPLMGRNLTVVGLTDDTAMFMTPLVFVTESTLTDVLGAAGTTGVVLVTTGNPEATAERLRSQGLTVRTPEELAGAARELTTRIFGVPIRLMVAVAFAAGVLIVALVSYTIVAEHRRDLGVLKAIGAPAARLRLVTLTLTLGFSVVGALVAVGLLVVARLAVSAWQPAFIVAVTPAALGRTAAAAAAMALLAAWVPARQVSRVDAATAFRSGS